MSLAIVYSRANIGIEAPQVTVEVHLSNGMPGFSIVGLPETAVRESRERVRSAIINSKLDFPLRRITVNLAPADLPKGGGRFDLAIALGILMASRQLKPQDSETLARTEFMGELALSGEVRPVRGVLPGVMACRDSGRQCIVPAGNADEAGLLPNVLVYCCAHLLDLCSHLRGENPLPKADRPMVHESRPVVALSDIVGQHQARRALIIAAAGGHNLLMRGPPGTGKTMLANRLTSLLPPLEDREALEVAAVNSISDNSVNITDCYRPPFRAPHHTSSAVALVGGGKNLKPGEITLAHRGVLFLDEITEFSPKVLEVLREPLESGSILISRATYQARLPARFQLVAAMNPCPCGYYGDREKTCRCPEEKVQAYQHRVSGPLLDRIDLHVEVPRLDEEDRRRLLIGREGGQDRDDLALITRCRQIQLERAGKSNASLDQAEILRYCQLQPVEKKLLENAVNRLRLSTRAYFRILKIARTLADLCDSDHIDKRHLLEAVDYRKFDRQA